MATLWIDNNMVIRWHEKWPDLKEHLYCVDRGQNSYEKAIVQAKAESLPVEYASGEPVTNVGGKPDSFFKVNGEVDVVEQFYNGSSWEDVAKLNADNLIVLGGQRRTIARLKPDSSAMSFTEWMDPGSIFTRDDVRSMVEQARAEALKDIRSRILEEFNKDIYHRGVFRTQDIVDAAMESLDKVLDKLNVK